MKVLFLLLFPFFLIASPVGSWEIDTKASLGANGELNKQEEVMILMLSEELFGLTLNADNSALLSKKDKAKWKKVDAEKYAIEVNGDLINFRLLNEKSLKITFEMGATFAINLLYVPEGSIKKEPRVLPKEFPNYDKVYRSELTKGEGKYQFMKLSKEGTLYEYYGSSEKNIDAALITNKLSGFSGEDKKLTLDAGKGVLLLSDDANSFTINSTDRFVLASFVDPTITPSSKMPWTKESIKEYTLKHPTLRYHARGYDIFAHKKIDEELEYKIEDYEKDFFDNPKGSMYTLITKADDGSLYRWSKFSPFVPNHVPKKNADKIVYTIDGEQSITTPAGTFLCTILNLDADGEVIKAWMINDRPGVYAKYVNFMATYTLVK